MDFSDALLLMRDAYSQAGFAVEEADHELIIQDEEREFRVLEEDIRTYAEQYELFADLVIAPAECSICSQDYREQVVMPVDPVAMAIPMHRLRDGIIFGDPNEEALYAETGPATDLFVNRLRFEEAYIELCKERMRRRYLRERIRREDVEDDSDIRNYMYSPITLRVHNLGAPSVEIAIRKSSPIIEGCLFELSYLKGISLALSEEWPRRQPRVRPFRYQDRIRENVLPLPKAMFNSDIVRFYQRGVSTRDPVIQFLSYYQVLEYFFLSVSDERLYETLSHRITDPRFSPKPSFLDRIIQDVLNHRRITNETEMLKLVLQKYVEPDDLIAFIRAYEEHLGERFYTKRKRLFGQDVPEIRFEQAHLYGNIAKRIKAIRNAIVHSSDRYERKERFVPLTSQSEAIISREIPLMKFLAERVIISTATP